MTRQSGTIQMSNEVLIHFTVGLRSLKTYGMERSTNQIDRRDEVGGRRSSDDNSMNISNQIWRFDKLPDSTVARLSGESMDSQGMYHTIYCISLVNIQHYSSPQLDSHSWIWKMPFNSQSTQRSLRTEITLQCTSICTIVSRSVHFRNVAFIKHTVVLFRQSHSLFPA